MASKAEPRIVVTERVARVRPDSGGRPPVAPIDSQAQLNEAIAATRDRIGVSTDTVALYLPEDWTRVDFPLDSKDKARAFVRSAFRYGGWRLLGKFRQDLSLAYRGIPQSVIANIPSALMLRKAQDQLREAIGALRPEVAAALDAIEKQAVAVLDAGLQASINAAITQADRLLIMPSIGGRRLGTQAFLDARFSRAGGLAVRKTATPLNSARADGKRFQDIIRALAPAAAKFATLNQAKKIQDAILLARKAIAAGAIISPAVTAANTTAMSAVAGLAQTKDIAALGELLSGQTVLIEAWRQAQARFSAARKAAADEFPVLYRFGHEDFTEGAKEDDAKLGGRIMAVLAPVHAGAQEVRKSYTRTVPGRGKAPIRPAKALLKAMAGDDPPDDPVSFVMRQAKASIWSHPALVQAAIETMARGTQTEPPFALLDTFTTAVSEQALAEGEALGREGVLVDVGVGIGLMAGMIALHCLAPPLALVADAALAAQDLSTSLAEFGSENAQSRCTFDPMLSLAEEPSLAWFLAGQAFNLLTVG